MKNHTDEEITAFMKQLCDKYDNYYNPELRENTVKITRASNAIEVEVSQMYEYINLPMKAILEMAEYFDTHNISDSRFAAGGCETCDYGSSYRITYRIAPEES